MEITKVNKIIEENNEQKLEILTKEELILIIKKYSISYESIERNIIEKESQSKIEKEKYMESIQNLESHIQMLESHIQILEANTKNSENNIRNLRCENDEICRERDNKIVKEIFVSFFTIVFLLCILLYRSKKKTAKKK